MEGTGPRGRVTLTGCLEVLYGGAVGREAELGHWEVVHQLASLLEGFGGGLLPNVQDSVTKTARGGNRGRNRGLTGSHKTLEHKASPSIGDELVQLVLVVFLGQV